MTLSLFNGGTVKSWLFWASVSFFIFIFVRMYTYWYKKEVRILPSKGSGVWIIPQITTFVRITSKYYEEMKKMGCKFAAIRSIFHPVLVVIDLDCIRDILTDPERKYFVDLGFYKCDEYELIPENQVFLDGRDLEDMRTKLTPITKSSTMKKVFPSVLNASDFMIEALEGYTMEKKDINVRELLDCFTADLVSLSSFNLNCSRYNISDNSDIQFYIQDFVSRFWCSTKINMMYNWPRISSVLGLDVDQSELTEYIYYWLRKTIAHRIKNKFHRMDFMGFLLDLDHYVSIKENSWLTNIWSKMPFFFCHDCFDVSCTTMYFAIYELCRNPDMQEIARNEINETLKIHDGEINWNSLTKMKYLQQIIEETLRMYPPATNLVRPCINPYKLKDSNLTITRPAFVIIPLFHIHRDAQYFPDPDKFEPERFNRESKKFDSPRMYMPFGEGPRDCRG